ncbi:TDT family transporter [Jatrophihabitans sp.]|uniref:TDT family transporter n=1 Tax=Jatrophihabitans sp. TaxID=1932789 RepID=UPI0030C6F315|nr:C4-dicarboxylate transporter [Jatrophihabitans sp.]
MTITAPAPVRRSALANVTPNWFATVMGTGIVAVAAVSVPLRLNGLRAAAEIVWVAAVLALAAVTTATALHWRRHPRRARMHLDDPLMAHFYGAVPMALLTVGAGTLLVGRDLLGLRAAVDLDWTLWILGGTGGLATAAVIPYRAVTRHRARPEQAFGGWLMSVVPPLVSASTGALLVPHAALRQPMLVTCYGLFALGLALSAPVAIMVIARLGAGPAALVPTVWIVLGPLGQSVTAANLLGGLGGQRAHDFGRYYGALAGTTALVWLGVAVRSTIARRPPFALTWWSFTFPLGTCVTGASALARATGFEPLRLLSVTLFAGLVTAWLIVATRTLRGLWTGALLGHPPL